MDLDIRTFAALLLVAALVAVIARRLRLPYAVGLVLAGGLVTVLHLGRGVQLTREMVFTIFLPPLVFEAALNIPWRELRSDFSLIALLATVGVFLSGAFTAAGMRYLAGWQWPAALVFGALIAATDPVSVIAMFKDSGYHGRLRLLAEAESLFNDGTASVAFAIAVAVAAGGPVGGWSIGGTLVVMILGGVVCGALVALGVLLVAGHTDDHLVEITLTTIAAYGSFLIAEQLHVSGVLAALTAGLVIGNMGDRGPFSERGREAVGPFWEYTAFVANSLVFLLIGMRAAQESFATYAIPVVAAIGLVTVGRALAVYPCCLAFARSALRVELRYQHVLFWGGLRGALALALALGLPADMPQRQALTTVAFGVVAFSVIIQGLTLRPVLRGLGLLPRGQSPPAPSGEEAQV